MSRPAIRRRAGFTLLEMLAVIALTALVLTVAADYYLDLSRASNEAVEAIRGKRRAVRLMDRLARELEGAVLMVKPSDVDPVRWPWLFVAEADDAQAGAQRVKFVTRSHRPRASSGHEQDLALLAYAAESDGDGGLLLWRSAQTQLPEELDRSFPRDERDGALLLAEDLAEFGMRFLTDDGEWVARFDSSQLAQSGQLPVAAEVELAFLEQDAEGEWVAGPAYQRRVVLPVRPFDLQAAIEDAGNTGGGGGDGEEDDEESGGSGGEEDEGGDATVGECLATVPDSILALIPDNDMAVIESMRDQPLDDGLRDLAAGYGINCP